MERFSAMAACFPSMVVWLVTPSSWSSAMLAWSSPEDFPAPTLSSSESSSLLDSESLTEESLSLPPR